MSAGQIIDGAGDPSGKRLDWRAPTPPEKARYERGGDSPAVHQGRPVGDYFDDLIGVADVAPNRFILGENIWSGFPDPDAYAVFELDAQDRVLAAGSADVWPANWTHLGRSGPFKFGDLP